MGAGPASPAPPPFPPHPVQIAIHVERVLGLRRGENYWVQNLVNMADGLTPLFLNPESPS